MVTTALFKWPINESLIVLDMRLAKPAFLSWKTSIQVTPTNSWRFPLTHFNWPGWGSSPLFRVILHM